MDLFELFLVLLGGTCAILPVKMFLGLTKMGPELKLGYVVRDNFSDTPHFETKLHASAERYKVL
jgi:hypothetical protein